MGDVTVVGLNRLGGIAGGDVRQRIESDCCAALVTDDVVVHVDGAAIHCDGAVDADRIVECHIGGVGGFAHSQTTQRATQSHAAQCVGRGKAGAGRLNGQRARPVVGACHRGGIVLQHQRTAVNCKHRVGAGVGQRECVAAHFLESAHTFDRRRHAQRIAAVDGVVVGGTGKGQVNIAGRHQAARRAARTGQQAACVHHGGSREGRIGCEREAVAAVFNEIATARHGSTPALGRCAVENQQTVVGDGAGKAPRAFDLQGAERGLGIGVG